MSWLRFVRGLGDAHAAARWAVMERAERDRCALVEREEQEEVSEARVIADGPPYVLGVDIKVGETYCLLCGENLTNVTYHACPMRASQAPTVSPELVSPYCLVHGKWCAGEPCWWTKSQTPAHAGADPTSVVPPAAEVDSPAGVSDIPPSPPVGRPNWVEWATPVICEVLADHRSIRDDDDLWSTGPVGCGCQGVSEPDFPDWQAWREHAALFIAARLEAAHNQREARK